MHFYQFNVKDYASATAHLTIEEDCCYRRLLDYYYDQEAPIESQKLDLVARRIRIPCGIIQTILDEFFQLVDGFYINPRADLEIQSYQAMRQGGKKGSDKRWNRGAIPTPLPPVSPGLSEANANHEPLTINQESTPLSGKPDVIPSEVPEKQKAPKQDAEAVIDFLNVKTGRKYRPTKANLDPILARMREGYTLQEIRTVTMRKVNDWLADEKMNEYLRPATLYTARNFNSYAGILT